MYRFPSFKRSNWLFFHEQYDGVNGKIFWCLMKKINFWLWAGWVASYLQRSLSAQVNGGSRCHPKLWKQPFSAVRASGGYPGNAKSRTRQSNSLTLVRESDRDKHSPYWKGTILRTIPEWNRLSDCIWLQMTRLLPSRVGCRLHHSAPSLVCALTLPGRPVPVCHWSHLRTIYQDKTRHWCLVASQYHWS